MNHLSWVIFHSVTGPIWLSSIKRESKKIEQVPSTVLIITANIDSGFKSKWTLF